MDASKAVRLPQVLVPWGIVISKQLIIYNIMLLKVVLNIHSVFCTEKDVCVENVMKGTLHTSTLIHLFVSDVHNMVDLDF